MKTMKRRALGIDWRGISVAALVGIMFYQSASAQPTPPGGGNCTNCPPYTAPPPDNRPNLIKYMDHGFTVVDTNEVFSDGDTNFYNALAAMPDDTGTNPVLTASIYGDSILIKAMHFDYSSESRDFCLVISDNPGDPLYKAVDFLHSPGESDSQNGWAVQGNIPTWQVTDPMFMQVSNISTDRAPAFFRAIPYSGPIITVTGANVGDTVSNTLALLIQISDLSGSTNEQCTVDVDGIPARYTATAARGSYQGQIQIQTPYSANGTHNVNVSALASARIYDPSNPPADTRLFFQGTSTLPLDFENANYVVWQSDNCSTEVGTNYFLFYVNEAQPITASISDPNTAQIVATYAGDVPAAATVQLAWNFTEADGVTPYSNDTYMVTVNLVNDPPPVIVFTNGIYRGGVRTAGVCMTSYEMDNPTNSAGAYFDTEAGLWIPTLAGEYESLYSYDFASATGYDPGQIGPNRDALPNIFPLVLDKGGESNFFSSVFSALASTDVSDFDFVGHGNGVGFGGGPDNYVIGHVELDQIGQAVFGAKPGGSKRMRKVALWTCYSDTPPGSRGGGVYSTLADSFGIKPSALQMSCWGPKNVGLFFSDLLNQGGYSGLNGGSVFELSVLFDELWLAGGVMQPGAADPTFSFDWAVRQMIHNSPEILDASPMVTGFNLLPYAGIYDGELMTNNTIHVRTQ